MSFEQQLIKARLGKYAARIVAMGRPAIRISTKATEDAEIPLGASKMGGRPDMPPGVAWPMRFGQQLGFLGQINLADVRDFVPNNPLPNSGRLLFFYDVVDMPFGDDPGDENGWKVLYITEPADRLRRTPGEKEDDGDSDCFNACQVTFAREMSYPSAGSAELSTLGLSDVQEEKLFDLGRNEDETPGDNPVHRMLGHARFIQGDTRRDCSLLYHRIFEKDMKYLSEEDLEPFLSDLDQWDLLLQLESDNEMCTCWYDCGTLYFWIHRNDLLAARFDRVRMFLQCY